MLISQQFDPREQELLARAAAQFAMFDDYDKVLSKDEAVAVRRAARLVATDRDAQRQAAALNQAATAHCSADGVRAVIAGCTVTSSIQVSDDGDLELRIAVDNLDLAVIRANRTVAIRHVVAGEDVCVDLYDVEPE